MGRSSLFENACTLLKLTEGQKSHLRWLNAALRVNEEDGVHIYMVVGEVVTKALDNHRLLTTTFLTDFERTSKGIETRMREAMADEAVKIAAANAAVVAKAIERKMEEVAQEQREKRSLWYTAMFLITLFFMSCAGWAIGDTTTSSSSDFWREKQTLGEAAMIQDMVSWNPLLLEAWSNCGPSNEHYGTRGGRRYCGYGIFADPETVQNTSNVLSFTDTMTPYIRSAWPFAVPLFAFTLGVLAMSLCHRWRSVVAKSLRPPAGAATR